MIMNFGDQQGGYDGATVQSQINQIKRTGTPEQISMLDDFLATLEYTRKLEKFNSILSNSVYYPKWYIEKQNSEAAALAKVSFVSYNVSKIPDTTIKISDKEIEDYVSKRKNMPEWRQEESRSIAYVIFDASPTSADSANIKSQVEAKKAEFAAAPDPAKFISSNASAIRYTDMFFPKSLIQVPAKDSIFALPKNVVYGPYLDGHTYVIAKKIDEKTLPDSVYCRHILFRTQGEGALPDSVAEKKIDSTINAIEKGSGFVTVMKAVSMDAAANSQDSLGIMRFSSMQIQDAQSFDPDFGKYILFDGKKGQRKKVKTKFGYHYIDIVDHKNIQTHYKIAYFAKNIIATEETERTVLDNASKFAEESKDLKTFDENIAKSNGQLEKLEATNIAPNAVSIQSLDMKLGMGFGQAVPCRPLIREIYEADKGDVLKEQRIGDQRNGYKYIVAVVTDILEKGLVPARIARPRVEPILRNEKRIEEVKKMIAPATTLEAVAAILKDSIVTVDSLRMQTRNAQGFSPKAIGAIFNNANKGKLINQPFEAANSIVVIRVDDITTTSVITGELETQKAQVRMATKSLQMQYSSPIRIMRNIANIKDNRRKFY
jgi:peptidyl-prolyl cis-trans isomerase D